MIRTKGLKKRVIACLGAVVVGAMSMSLSLTAFAKPEWPGGVAPTSVGETSIVMDVDSGAVLYGFNENEQHFPASITKVMTALVAIENGNLDDMVTFSREAVYNIDRVSSHIARDVGEEMPLRDCLYGMMLESANECAYAIAEHVGGGSFDTFINMMNEKAQSLGCTQTHFVNPNGLHDESHVTCAYDMALIAREAYKNPAFVEIVGTKNYTIPPTNLHPDGTYLNNHHAMLHPYKTSKYVYEFCTGGKTGYTDQARNTLVTYAVKDGKTLVCVIMNAENGGHNYADTRSLFDYCFSHFQTIKVGDQIQSLTEETEGAAICPFDITRAKIDPEAAVTIPEGAAFSDLKMEAVPYDEIVDKLAGELRFHYGDRLVGTAKLYYDGDFLGVEEPQEEKALTIMGHRRFEGLFTKMKPFLIPAAAIITLIYFRYKYVTAPYNHYYGSKILRAHFRKKRKRRRQRERARRR